MCVYFSPWKIQALLCPLVFEQLWTVLLIVYCAFIHFWENILPWALIPYCALITFFRAISKGKSPEVPFHGITSSYSYFEVIWIFAPISKKQNMIKKNYQLNRNKKFVDKAQQCFAFLHIEPKFKFSVQWSWFLES